jgi:vacuolar-type H+-ATPase subunit I/STV1
MVGFYPISEAYKRIQNGGLSVDSMETFAANEEDAKKSIIRIFVSVSLMVLAILIGFVFLWSYRRERTLMIVVLSAVIFIYAILVLVFTLVQREKLDNIYFLLLTGSSAFMTTMAVLLIIVFSIIASRRMNDGYMGDQARDYLSRAAAAPSSPPSVPSAEY